MRLSQSFFLLAVAGSTAQAGSEKITRPRGVAPECKSLSLQYASVYPHPEECPPTAGVYQWSIWHFGTHNFIP